MRAPNVGRPHDKRIQDRRVSNQPTAVERRRYQRRDHRLGYTPKPPFPAPDPAEEDQNPLTGITLVIGKTIVPA